MNRVFDLWEIRYFLDCEEGKEEVFKQINDVGENGLCG